MDVALLSEPYKDIISHNWTTDADKQAALWVLSGETPQCKMTVLGKGYVWVKLQDVYYVSCYAPPRWTIEDFSRMMMEIETELRGKRPIIIAGDFNAWSRTWGSAYTNTRGRIVEDTFAAMNLVLLNDPGTFTFECVRGRSIIDLAFADSGTAARTTWKVEEAIYTHSDHKAIIIDTQNAYEQPSPRTQQIKWKKSAFNVEAFEIIWEDSNLTETSAEGMSEQLAAQFEFACDASMPRCTYSGRRKPAYWWTTEIANIRKACIKARRRAQRARHRPAFEELHTAYRERRRELKTAIQQSKTRCFNQMRNSADDDPWGLAYKTVMQSVKGPRAPQPTCPILLEQIVLALFPPQEERRNQQYAPNALVPPVTIEEVMQKLHRIQDSKAPGPDGVPNVVFKTAVRSKPQMFAELYSVCLKEGVFPSRWKLQRLVLLLKPGKQPDLPAAYRPLCMLDTVGKMFERIISDRLQEYLEANSGLSDMQFGFRKARSTVDAIRIVTNIATEACSGGYSKMKYCAVITLDVKNAFNSANWQNVLLSLEGYNVPNYLLRILSSYLSNRVLQYETSRGTKNYNVTGGVPQGSVLGPTLWNAMYDGVLKLQLPDSATIIGYADDIALVVVDKRLDNLEAKCNDAAARVQRWLNNAGLELASQKTEVVLISARRQKQQMKLHIGGHDIMSQEAIKYLGVMIDSRLSFKHHLTVAGAKAEKVNGALSRILPNIGGPQGARRRLLSTVVDSITLYAAPVWAQAKRHNIQLVAQVQRRSALRVACAYRTVSEDAINVIAGKLPTDIRARELSRLYNRQGATPTPEQRSAERSQSIAEWQQRWQNSSSGRWTYALIPHIKTWITRCHGQLDYNLTQLLTGHGCFLEYLHRFRLADSPVCPRCPNELESAEHVAFYCERFTEERRMLEEALDCRPTAANLITQMCMSTVKYNAVCEFARQVMRKLQTIEKERKAQEQQQQ